MPDRRRFAVVVPPLLAALLLIGVAAAILLPSGAAPAAAQGTEPAVTCFEIGVGWRICAAPGVPLAPPPGPCATGASRARRGEQPRPGRRLRILLAAKHAARDAHRVTELRLEGHALGHDPGRAGRPQSIAAVAPGVQPAQRADPASVGQLGGWRCYRCS